MKAPPRLLSGTERLMRAASSFAGAAMLGMGSIVNPQHPLPIDVCVLKNLTGLPCLTCGLTRSMCHVLQGDIAGSMSYHPAGLLMVIAVAGWTAWTALEAWRGRWLFSRRAAR